MTDYTIWAGDVVQFEAGDIDPMRTDLYGIALATVEEGEVDILLSGGAIVKKPVTALYRPQEGSRLSKYLQQEAMKIINSQRSLRDIWNDPRFPG